MYFKVGEEKPRILLTQCIYVLRVMVRINSTYEYFPMQRIQVYHCNDDVEEETAFSNIVLKRKKGKAIPVTGR
jgi:hypothetical protein